MESIASGEAVRDAAGEVRVTFVAGDAELSMVVPALKGLDYVEVGDERYYRLTALGAALDRITELEAELKGAAR